MKNIINGASIMNMKVEQLPYLIEGLIPKTGLVCLGGSSDTGKSSLLRQLAVSISAGRDEFLGFKLNQTRRRVLYISTEDDSTAMAYLLNKYSGIIKPEQLENLLFMFDTTDYFLRIEEVLSENPVDAIIVDAFTDLFPGQINVTNEVRRYLNIYSNIAEKHQCAVIFLHHTGKRTEDLLPSKSNLIGSQGFEGKMRLVLELRKDRKDNSYRHLCIVKGNYIRAIQRYKCD
jgi:RecA-family ATPase